MSVPLEPRSSSGKRYIFTLVDYTTRYPEAIALSNISTETVADAMLDIFSRVGIPEEIASDRGSQFTASMMKEVRRLLSIKHLPTTPYHAMGNGLVEKFNGTLNSVLKKMCIEQPRLWDKYLPAILFVYREAPQVSLGFSPFELLFGRTVKGPLNILKDLWEKERKEGPLVSLYEYVFQLRDKLEETCRLAHSNLSKVQKRYKYYFDRKTKDRKFKAGDKVLLLLPTSHNKLLLQWKGPFEVLEVKGKNDYYIDKDGHRKLYHANLMKKFITRSSMSEEEVSTVAVLETSDDNGLMDVSVLETNQKEFWTDVKIGENLSKQQKEEVEMLFLSLVLFSLMFREELI